MYVSYKLYMISCEQFILYSESSGHACFVTTMNYFALNVIFRVYYFTSAYGQVHWEREDMPKPPEDSWYWYRAPSAEVEMTGYVLMSLIYNGKDYIGYTPSIVQWLTKQRNPYGGFSSTQVLMNTFDILIHYMYLLM